MDDSALRRLLDPGTPAPRVIVQGVTGRVARNNIRVMQSHGTPIVAGVSARADAPVEGIPVFPDCAAAVAAAKAEASVAFVPPLAVLSAIAEAVAAGIRLIVTVTEGMPVLDALRAKAIVDDAGAVWIGACSPGIAQPGRFKLGFLPEASLAPGPVAIWSKSGTLSYEIGLRLVGAGLGQSAWIGVGGDAVKGTRFADLIPAFRDHAPTRAVVVIGEIGGSEEEEMAEALRATPIGKPVHAILAGASAPEGVTMGHAGAIISGGQGTLAGKTAALRGAGVEVFDGIAPLVQAVAAELAGQSR